MYLQKMLKRHAVIFLVSDFLDTGFEKPLRVLSRKHDLIAIQLIDPREKEMPRIGPIELEDSETGELALVDFRSKKVFNAYQKTFEAKREATSRLFQSMKVDKVDIVTTDSYVEPLIKFFRNRERRRR